MIDEPQPGTVPENVAKPKQEGQGMVSSYPGEGVNALNPTKIDTPPPDHGV